MKITTREQLAKIGITFLQFKHGVDPRTPNKTLCGKANPYGWYYNYDGVHCLTCKKIIDIADRLPVSLPRGANQQ